jgi:hypothetical protein
MDTYIENEIFKECHKMSNFNSSANQLDLEHIVHNIYYKYAIKEMTELGVELSHVSDKRITDLVHLILQKKDKIENQTIHERLEKIDKGDKTLHLEKLNLLKNIYTFTDDDIMKLSCWLTQIKRTAYNIELSSPAALIFYSSKQCTGKSTLMTLIKKAVLSSYQNEICLRNLSIEQIFARFNPIELIRDLVITIDEIGYMDKDISAQLKTLITETNEIRIEKKYCDPFYARKIANFLITTNDEPASLFYGDAHTRRLSVIENFDKKKQMTNDELYEIVNDVWLSAPIEYAFDTEQLMQMNLNRVNTNNDFFEALLTLYTYQQCNDCDNETSLRKPFTVQKLYKRFRDVEREVPKKSIKSYLETTPEYFRVQTSGRLTRYYATDKLMNDLITEYNIDDEKKLMKKR